MTAKTEPDSRISFTAKNIYYSDQNAPTVPSFSVAPDADQTARKGPAGRVLSLLQHVCGYEDFAVNSVQVTGSVVTGMKTDLPDGGWLAQGYEWFCLINGDRMLAEISEKGSDAGSEGKIKIVQGTGSLVGITGEGTYSNQGKPGDAIVISILTGWYSLPAAETPAAHPTEHHAKGKK